MAIRYFHQPDEVVPTGPAFTVDDDHDWWAGAQKCGATIALAAVLAAAAVSTAQAAAVDAYHQDDPAGVLSGQPDEDFWINPVTPAPATLGRLYLPDAEEIPATTLRGQPDEDFYLPPLPWPTSSRAALVDDDTIVPQPSAFNLDEDSWQNLVAPVPATLGRLYLPDPDEIPATTLRGQPDEDFYLPPLPWPTSSRAALIDDDTIVPQPAAFNLDEDLWQNPVAPIAATLGRIYLPDPEEISAGVLFGQPDEDLWIPPRPTQFAPAPKAFADDDVLFPVAAPFTPDEDYWRGSVWQTLSQQVRAFADDEVFFPVPPVLDEGLWLNPVAPSPFRFLPFPAFDAGEIASIATGPATLSSLGAAVRPAIDSQSAAVRSAIDSQGAVVRPAIDSLAAAVRPAIGSLSAAVRPAIDSLGATVRPS